MTGGATVVGGRYELGQVLGRGGMAEVRQAVDTRLGRRVAVKLLRPDLATDPTFQARFRREAQSAAGLNHPTIVAVYDTGEEIDPVSGVAIPYIVMELVEGQTLRDVLREGRKILPERALELTQGVLDALSYSHLAGIVHRDIKPANVMLTPNGGIKVMDFGIARAVADTSATMTQTAAVIGTAQYLSPEQARGETVDARSDIYSAGCLLYELLVRRPPFVGDSPVSVAYQHVRELPLPPSAFDAAISPDIDALTLKALAKDPRERYQSAREMKNDIARVLAGGQATAVVPPAAASAATRVVPPAVAPVVVERVVEDDEPGRSGAGVAVLVSLLILALIGGSAYAFYRYLSPSATPPATTTTSSSSSSSSSFSVSPSASGKPSAQQVTVPAVLGNTQAEADSNLRNARLVPQFKNVNGKADQSVNTATKQTPDGGATVAANSTVVVEINVGPKTATVPTGLLGRDKNAAKRTLTAAGFTNVTLAPADPEPVTAHKDEVLAVTPNEGQSVALDQNITITYASGMSPVPLLTGRLRSQAASDAKAAGFRVRFKTVVSSQPAGIVFRQRPSAGERRPRGTRITLTVAKNAPSPPPTNPPTNPPTQSPSAPPTSSPPTSSPPTPPSPSPSITSSTTDSPSSTASPSG